MERETRGKVEEVTCGSESEIEELYQECEENGAALFYDNSTEYGPSNLYRMHKRDSLGVFYQQPGWGEHAPSEGTFLVIPTP